MKPADLIVGAFYTLGVQLMGGCFGWPYWAGVGVWMTGLGITWLVVAKR